MTPVAALVSAALLGLSGSTHCALMCGPVSSLLGAGCARRGVASQAGRATTYVVLGALAGAVGERLGGSPVFGAMASGARVLVAVTLFLAGLALAGASFRLRLRLPGASALGWIRSRLTAGLDSPSLPLAFGRGLAWGLLPCGLVYAALALAAASGSPVLGAVVMATFAGFTLPVFALLGLFQHRLASALRHVLVRRVAALVLVGAGLAHMALVARDRGFGEIGAPRPCCAHKHGGGS